LSRNPITHTVEGLRDRTETIPYDGCWIWMGATSFGGYGSMTSHNKRKNTHRVMYELVNGPIPEGKVIMHTCDNPACINPAHLRTGTLSENMEDCVRKNRLNNPKGETHFRSKFTSKDIIKIRNSEYTNRKLAAAYGVTHSTIAAIKNNKTWRHVS